MNKEFSKVDSNLEMLNKSLFADLNFLSVERSNLIKAISFTNIKHLDSTMYKDIFDPFENIIQQVTGSHYNLYEQFESVIGKISNIIKISEINKIKKWIGGKPTFKLLFSATKDGFLGTSFHTHCDGKAPTITIVSTTDKKIFGAFTVLPWKSDGSYSDDSSKKGFIFSLATDKKYGMINTSNAIHNPSSYGPTFGGGHDMHIANNCNADKSSYMNIGSSYEKGDSTVIAGGYNFMVSDYEVFKVE